MWYVATLMLSLAFACLFRQQLLLISAIEAVLKRWAVTFCHTQDLISDKVPICQIWPTDSDGQGQLCCPSQFSPCLSILSSWVHGHLNILLCNNWWCTNFTAIPLLGKVEDSYGSLWRTQTRLYSTPCNIPNHTCHNTYSTRCLHYHHCGLL